jgi:hypothetical protein
LFADLAPQATVVIKVRDLTVHHLSMNISTPSFQKPIHPTVVTSEVRPPGRPHTQSIDGGADHTHHTDEYSSTVHSIKHPPITMSIVQLITV